MHQGKDYGERPSIGESGRSKMTVKRRGDVEKVSCEKLGFGGEKRDGNVEEKTWPREKSTRGKKLNPQLKNEEKRLVLTRGKEPLAERKEPGTQRTRGSKENKGGVISGKRHNLPGRKNSEGKGTRSPQ